MITFVTMTTYASPPRMWPTTAVAKATSRCVIPTAFINSPARKKNGIASRGKLSTPATIWCGMTVSGSPWPKSTRKTAVESPMEKTTGMP